MTTTRPAVLACLLMLLFAPRAGAQLIAVPDTASVVAGVAYDSEVFSVLANDLDADGDSLTAVLVQDAAHGTLNLRESGSFWYLPDPGFEGTDRFVYRAVSDPVQRLGLVPGESVITFEATVGTPIGSDSDRTDIGIAGAVHALVWPDTGSVIDSIRVVGIAVANTDSVALEFRYGNPITIGTLDVRADSGEVRLSLPTAGPPAAVVGPFAVFAQSENKLGVQADVWLQGGGLLAGQVPADAQSLETETDWNIIGNARLTDDTLRVQMPVILQQQVDLSGTLVDLNIVGTAVAHGVRRASRGSNDVEVVLQVASPTSVEAADLPAEPSLRAAFPNPFRSSTTLTMVRDQRGEASLRVYDLLGREVATLFDGYAARGEHAFVWNAGSAPAGIYFARLTTARGTAVQALLVR